MLCLLVRIIAIPLLLAGLAVAQDAAPPATETAGDLPKIILDESAPNWRVDRFAGNSMGGQQFVQGPARQTAGLYGPVAACAPDGTVYMTAGAETKWAASRIVRVTPDGRLRLLAGGGGSLEDGPASRALIRVNTRTSPGLAYSATDQSIYFCHSTIPCIRRLYQKDGQWLVQTVAGSPTEAGTTDGSVTAARFLEPRSLAIDSKGTIYVLDGRKLLRKIANGQVLTLAKFKDGEPVDGPFDQVTMEILMCGMIAMGENDDTLYITDFYHRILRKADLKTGVVSTVAGMPKPKGWTTANAKTSQSRYGFQCDGPALTAASFYSGCAYAVWDPVHQALWCGGPDDERQCWLKNGWIKTVLKFKGAGGFFGNPERKLDQVGIQSTDLAPVSWSYIRAVDLQGGVYLYNGACPTGLWRAHEIGK
jgi:sugar lactone lactonase YvrE